MNFFSSPEAIVMIFFTVLNIAFLAGVYYQTTKNRTTKLDNHDIIITDVLNKVEGMSTKINLIESDLNANKTNVHKIANELNVFKVEINKRFESNDKQQIVILMLLERLCKVNNVETDMVKILKINR